MRMMSRGFADTDKQKKRSYGNKLHTDDQSSRYNIAGPGRIDLKVVGEGNANDLKTRMELIQDQFMKQ